MAYTLQYSMPMSNFSSNNFESLKLDNEVEVMLISHASLASSMQIQERKLTSEAGVHILSEYANTGKKAHK